MQKMVMKRNITTIENERENGNWTLKNTEKICMMNSEYKEENDDERLLLLVYRTF